MGHPLRWFEPGALYEVTSRTIREQFQLRPCDASRDLILGVIGRAHFLYPRVNIHYFVYMSNHVHFYLSSSDGESLAYFVGFVNGNVARLIGRLRESPGPLWGRRMRPIRVVDDEAMVNRLRYLVSQGCKEGLVASPGMWPGASAYPAFVGDMVLHGTWHDRNAERQARRGGREASASAFCTKYPVVLTPIPAWAHLSPEALRTRHQQIADDVTRETAEHNRRIGRTPIGARAVRETDPLTTPRVVKRAPAPLCHASSRQAWARFKEAYAAFVDAYRAAAATVRAGVVAVSFPTGAFPRGMPFVAWPMGAVGVDADGRGRPREA